MSRVLRLRSVSEEEAEQVRKLATSRTQPARLVQRARIIQLLLDNPKLPTGEAGRQVGYKSDYPGQTWVKRFNEHGIQGLEDKPRSGHPPFYDEATRSSLIDMVLQKPRSLGYPFELWTQGRLRQAFKERYDIHLAKSTVWSWVNGEGLKWKRQQSWFHDPEKHDPEFVEKRGPSFMPTPMPVSQVPHESG